MMVMIMLCVILMFLMDIVSSDMLCYTSLLSLSPSATTVLTAYNNSSTMNATLI